MATPSQEASVLSPRPLDCAPKFSEAQPTEAAWPWEMPAGAGEGGSGQGQGRGSGRVTARMGRHGTGALSRKEAAQDAHPDSGLSRWGKWTVILSLFCRDKIILKMCPQLFRICIR